MALALQPPFSFHLMLLFLQTAALHWLLIRAVGRSNTSLYQALSSPRLLGVYLELLEIVTVLVRQPHFRTLSASPYPQTVTTL
jgi:hypothetical protein